MDPITVTDERGVVATTEFTATCPCGVVVQHSRGQEQSHECRPITAQQVRDAWAEGYAWAKQETVILTRGD